MKVNTRVRGSFKSRGNIKKSTKLIVYPKKKMI